MDNIETNGLEAAFASRLEPAWHGLGVVTDETVSGEKLFELAKLNNWNVRLELVEWPEGYRPVRESYGVVRDNPFDGKPDVLSVVGERYHAYQNEQLRAFGDDIAAHGGRWETAGSIKQGRQIFASMTTDTDTVLDPKGRADKINNYLLLTTSHDGSISIVAANTPVRVVCQNTLNLALSRTKQSYKIRHTKSAEGRVQQAREALNIQVAYMDEFSVMANEMIETEITDDQFNKLVKQLYPKPESKAGITRWTKRTELLEAIYTGQGDGPNTAKNVVGTAWGALNALTEAIDWYRKPRGGNVESVLSAASGFDPIINAEKSRIFKATKALVTS